VTTGAGSDGWSVLVVCTGNICRSPAAELLLRAGLGEGSGTSVASAGLEARTGEPVAAPVARLLRDRGLDPAGWTARQLLPGMVAAADLVLTMTAAQRTAVVTRVPAAVRRTATLAEFAGLAELAGGLPVADPASRLAALVRAAPRARALRPAGPGDDVEDPYGRSDAVHARVVERIAMEVDRLLAVVLGSRPVIVDVPTDEDVCRLRVNPRPR
jgi:protein-tyrosine phosphatase